VLILTRSRRIRRALRIVRKQIPTKDWRAIASFVEWLRCESGWQRAGLMSELSKNGGGLFPLYDPNVPPRDQKNPRGQVRFALPICRLYSDKALIGLVAHELAHAVRAARLGAGWYERMDRRYLHEERVADIMVSRWGLRSQIKAMRQEQRKTVVPLLYQQEPHIMQLLYKRVAKDEEAVRERFSRTLATQPRQD